MEKIKLHEMAETANKNLLRARKERTEKFVENSVIPQLIDRAQKGDHSAKVHIPADQDIRLARALVGERVECEVDIKGRYLSVSWWRF